VQEINLRMVLEQTARERAGEMKKRWKTQILSSKETEGMGTCGKQRGARGCPQISERVKINEDMSVKSRRTFRIPPTDHWTTSRPHPIARMLWAPAPSSSGPRRTFCKPVGAKMSVWWCECPRRGWFWAKTKFCTKRKLRGTGTCASTRAFDWF
jgi:hypothetical protein